MTSSIGGPVLSKEKSQMGSSVLTSNKNSEGMPPIPSLDKAKSSFFKTPSAPADKDKQNIAAKEGNNNFLKPPKPIISVGGETQPGPPKI